LKKEIFYISNLISLSRFLLLGVTVYFLIEKNYLFTLIFIALIWISDLLDGYFARSRNEISELGKIIDPVADKVCVITIVLMLLAQGLIPLWFVIITILRDALILAGGLYLNTKKNTVLQSNWMGKLAVFTIGLTLFISILTQGSKLGQFGNYFSYHTEFMELLYIITLLLSIVMIFISLYAYFNRFLTILKK
jgi:CDP-diacylglycerol---glycerol-3-phosphate 3-phosphatidyltransferase